MAKKKRKKSGGRSGTVIGSAILILALLALTALITHDLYDDARITGSVDPNLDPFDIQYRNQGGMIGAYLSYALTAILGWLAYFLPVALILSALRSFSSGIGKRIEYIGSLAFAESILGTIVYNIHLLVKPTIGMDSGAIGGYLLEQLSLLTLTLLGETGGYIVGAGLMLMLLLAYTSIWSGLVTRFSLPSLAPLIGVSRWIVEAIRRVFTFDWVFSSESEGDDEDYQDESTAEEDRDDYQADTANSEDEPELEITEAGDKSQAKRKTTLKRKSEQVQVKSVKYVYPDVNLLDDPAHTGASASNDELQMTARMLKETLETFQVTVEDRIDCYPGPVITRFEFKPAAGIKINRIVSLADDLALALKARRIRIVAPIPGKAAVGVEIPNRKPQSVHLKEILTAERFTDQKLILPLALGKDIAGRPYVTDLAKMPHLLIAGATGSGKSVCMNALITSLIFRLHPVHVRFVFIDPKMLELSIYSGIPHLGRPVVTKPKRAEKVLTDIVVEMENRYRKLANASVRNIEDFNARQKEPEDKLPYIVVAVDELADLMMSATSSKIELLITRLAQMARAVGIHLILATQRPSVDVITGLIKANFPARIAFQVSSKVDSRTIIDANGAEKLLGSGDMLFLNSGQPEPVRIHGAYISSAETERLVEFIKEQGLEMMTLENISQATGEATESEVDLGDPLFKEACEVVIRHKQGSVSLLQRRLGIGYQRAARLIDKLEQAGVVSTFDGSKARDVLVDKSYLESVFGNPADKMSEQSG